MIRPCHWGAKTGSPFQRAVATARCSTMAFTDFDGGLVLHELSICLGRQHAYLLALMGRILRAYISRQREMSA